jgi:hypothetical protein
MRNQQNALTQRSASYAVPSNKLVEIIKNSFGGFSAVQPAP